MSYRLLGGNVSPFVRKCRLYMAEKGLDYSLEPVSPFSPPAGFRDLSPLGKIPLLVDGERALADSSVICLYLERLHPTPALYPADPWSYARALWLEEYIDGGLIPVVGPQVFRPLVIAPMRGGPPVTPEVKAAARQVVTAQVHPLLDYLEGQLGGARFFVEDRCTIADLAVASALVILRYVDAEPEAGRWPGLAAFFAHMCARPSLAPLLEEERVPWDARERLRAV